MRTNYAPNPSSETGVWLSNNGGIYPTSLDTTVKRSGTQSTKSTPNAGQAVLLSAYNVGGNPMPVSPGETIAASVYVAHNAAATASAAVTISFLNDAFGVVKNVAGQTVAAIAGTTSFVARPWATGVAPDGATQFRIIVTVTRSTGAVVAGEFAWADDCLIERSSSLGQYFDGDSINSKWLGAAGGSVSVWRGLASTGERRNLCTNPRPTTATGWAQYAGTGGAGVASFPTGVGCPDSDVARRFTWTTASTAAGGQYYVQSAGAMAGRAGTVCSASVWARLSKAAPMRILFYAYNSAAGFIAGGPQVTVNVEADTWTRFSCDGWTLPAGTDKLLVGVYTTTGTYSVGDWHEMTAVLIEPGPVAGPFFDGDVAGARWDSAEPSTSRALALPDANPNWPTVAFRVWADENPPATPFTDGPTTSPLELMDRTLSMRTSRGRQYELDEDEAGTASVVAVNDDGGLTGSVVDGRIPMRLADLRATWQGKTHTLFTGYVRSWPDQAVDPATNRSSVDFVDLFEALSNRPLQSIMRETVESLSVKPTLYYPLSDQAASAGAGNVVAGTAYPTAPLVDFKLGGTGTMKFGGSSFLTNDSDTCLTNANATGPSNKATQVQVGGPQVPAGPSLDTTRPWLLTMQLQPTAGASTVFSVLDRRGQIWAYISFDYAAQQVTVYAGGAGFVWNLTGLMDFYKDAGGLQVAVGYDGTTGIGYVIGGNKATWAYTPDGVLSWIGLGQAFNSSVIWGSSQADFSMAHVALFTGTLPTATDIGTLSAAANNAYTGQTVMDRLGVIQKWAGQTGTYGDQVPQGLWKLPDTKGSAALDVMRQAALDVNARLLISESGLVTTWSRQHGQDTDPKWVFGSDEAAGELPYTGGPGFEFDPTHVFNDVQVTRTDGAIQRWVNQSSIDRYFTRVLQATTNLYFDADAQYMAQWMAGRYADPDQRIGEIVLDPGANPALWDCVLNMVLSDVVQVNHRDLTGVRTGLFQVAKIEHTIDGGKSWKVTLQLTPHRQFWLLAAMHTTLAAGVAAGVTSLSLAPLPDSGTNPAEASIGVGTTLQLDPGQPTEETVTVASVTSVPTARTTGYTSITVGLAAATTSLHLSGAVVCDPLPSGQSDPTRWDARSVLGSTAITNY